MKKIISLIVNTIFSLGYPGIIFLMFLESSFFPFPSEVVIPPAGYLASQGKMSLIAVIVCGIVGSILGALFNYWIAIKFGRKFLIKFVKEEKLIKVEKFFDEHGHISTFIGRLIPVIRQYISFPAGLAKMNISIFIVFTAAGAGIWIIILALIGYIVGNNKELILKYSHEVSFGLIIVSAIIVAVYIKFRKRNLQKR